MRQGNSLKEKFNNADLLSAGSITAGAGILTGIISVVSLFFPDRRELITGLLFGFIFSVINFRLLKSAMERSVLKDNSKAAAAYVTGQYFLRFFMKALVLYVAFASEKLNTAAVIAGLLSVNAAIYVLNLINTKKSNKE